MGCRNGQWHHVYGKLDWVKTNLSNVKTLFHWNISHPTQRLNPESECTKSPQCTLKIQGNRSTIRTAIRWHRWQNYTFDGKRFFRGTVTILSSNLRYWMCLRTQKRVNHGVSKLIHPHPKISPCKITLSAQCETTQFTEWTPCSVTCGKGIRMRSRQYRNPALATESQCNRQLVNKEMCVADVPECE